MHPFRNTLRINMIECQEVFKHRDVGVAAAAAVEKEENEGDDDISRDLDSLTELEYFCRRSISNPFQTRREMG